MIKSVELGNFLSHPDTKIEFDNGVTVFVGENGAGKSSIIDAITFALFGSHTRKSNKGLIKRGENQGFCKVAFSVNDKEYLAERKLDSKGGLSANFSEKKNGEYLQIAAGERKQFGESMTSEIENKIGLSFEKLKIASIVQQGELNSIVRAKPKDFKELLNTIIGIDRLDVASEQIKSVKRLFREKILAKIGYDDTHLDILTRDLEKYQKEYSESIPIKEKLSKKRQTLEKILAESKKKLETETGKLEKITQLDSRRKELLEYAKTAISEIQHEIAEKERKIRDCEGCFEHLGAKDDLAAKLKMAESAIESTQKRLVELSNLSVSLQEKQSLAKKLKLKDNKCPVCDSHVDKLNPLFQERHLTEEIAKIEKETIQLEKESQMYSKKKNQFFVKLQEATEAEATLKAHSIKDKTQLDQMRQEILQKKSSAQIPLNASGNLVEIGHLDSHAKTIYESITILENETKGFDEFQYWNLKSAIEEKQTELAGIDREIGGISQRIAKSQEQIIQVKKAISELVVVKEYVSEIDDIAKNIFNRDGPVATSLRSWALLSISQKASEYLALLNTKIQRIQLTEKARDVSITCYAKNQTLDLESLSGGEQVSVALALRLGMARLLGASNLNLMILDEPTTHLDAERRKALVSVLSQLTSITNSGIPMQFIIITHDSEIFEDSNVERIYKFESIENGSKVTAV